MTESHKLFRLPVCCRFIGADDRLGKMGVRMVLHPLRANALLGYLWAQSGKSVPCSLALAFGAAFRCGLGDGHCFGDVRVSMKFLS